ncbi:tetratricopeptide repeat protein [Candidatus Daviesbacteria bacterium]|nr:tetratricopeptide repeat protein [Candidatus Daviesbacteria bacterium]
MPLTHAQKNYIKKHIRKEGISQIAQAQNISEKEILEYLKKHWGEEKFHSFLIQQGLKTKESLKPHGFKAFIKDHWLNFLLLIFLIFGVYTNSFNNAFLSDDLAEIVQNPRLGEFSNIFTRPFGFIRLFLYWLAFHISGFSPFIFRFINIFFHTGSVILVYILFNLMVSKRIALFVAAIFAVHPAISEAVVWISGGGYPQYAFFFLLSFVSYILSKNSKTYYLLSIISFLFAFMSHPQMPMALFLVFPLWEFIFGNLRKNWLKTLPYLLLTIAFLLITLNYLSERETTLQTVHYQEKGMDNPLLLIIIAITSYFELIFFPKILTLYHSELNFGQIQFIIRSLITLIFSVGILVSFKKNKFIFFWLSFFLIALAPTLTPFRLNWVVAERYLYLPIIGILALVGLGWDKLDKILKFKQIIYISFVITIAVLSIRTFTRNIDWKNEDNLWIATGKTSPSSPNTHNNLGDVYGRWGDKQAALKEFQTAIALKPNYGDAYHNLANIYNELKEKDKALENYQNALKYNPSLWQSYQNIAAIYYEQKKYDLALDSLQKAIQISPANLQLRNNLGVTYLISEDKNKAKEVFNTVLSFDPNNQTAKQGLIEANK